jgi:hypothetical protein
MMVRSASGGPSSLSGSEQTDWKVGPTIGGLEFLFSSAPAGIILRMHLIEQITRTGRLWPTALAGPVGIAMLASLVVCAHRASPRKPNPTASLTPYVAAVMTPTTSVNVTAGPAVTSPTARVARFSIWLLPIIAAVVDVSRLHEVAVARIGGLHGP